MLNSSLSYFILGAYLPLGNLKLFFLLLTASLYVLILFLNLSLVVVICFNRTLHEPMHVFLCSLFMNELYGSTGLFSLLLHQISKDVHTVSITFCFFQIFCFYTYANVELCTLAVMSYDRYVAICRPLQYNMIMTANKVSVLIVLIWIYSFIRCLITISLNLRLTLCGNVIDHLFCHNYLIVRLACSDTRLVNNIYGFLAATLSLLVPLLLILFSYGHILTVALGGHSSQGRQKAVHTCTPHIVSLLNFTFGSFSDILQTRFDTSAVPIAVRIFLALYFSALQPLLNPIMYGIQMGKIRRACKDYVGKMLHVLNFKKFKTVPVITTIRDSRQLELSQKL